MDDKALNIVMMKKALQKTEPPAKISTINSFLKLKKFTKVFFNIMKNAKSQSIELAISDASFGSNNCHSLMWQRIEKDSDSLSGKFSWQ